MGQITFGGLASGLDTNAIISALVGLERRPIELLGVQRSEEQSKLSLYGTLEGLVKTLQTKAEEVAGDFFAFKLSNNSESTADITLSSGAQSGSHTLEVASLAAADRYTFAGVPDPTVGLGAGSITFDYESDSTMAGQESFTVNITAGNDSLNDIATAINSQAGDAVTASVINVGTTVNPTYQLVLAGNDTGEDYTIDNLQVTDTALTVGPRVTSATNAQVTLDGIDIERSTNVFSDVLAGVSFTVSETTFAGSPAIFTIDADAEGVKQNVQGFVDAYNSVINFINTQNEFDPETGPGGDLFGDPALRTIQNTIQSALLDVDIEIVKADAEGFSTMNQVGVELASDGTLSIDDDLFDSKLSENSKRLGELFTLPDPDLTNNKPEGGLLVKLDAAIEKMIKDSTAMNYDDPLNPVPILNPATQKPIALPGLFNARRGAINSIISDLDKEVTRLERNVTSFEEDLILRYSKLESLIGGLNAQSQYLNLGLGLSAS